MVETQNLSAWTKRHAWQGVLADGQYGKAGKTGVTVRLRNGPGIATFIASTEGHVAVGTAIRERLGFVLPLTPEALCAGDLQAVWNGPGQWLIIADNRERFQETLADLAKFGAVSDQSDSRAVLSLSGVHVYDVLAKGVMIDLHPADFPIGAAASTSIAHVGVSLWRRADDPAGPVFEVMVARSFFGSFWSWFSASVAEFGCTVVIEDVEHAKPPAADEAVVQGEIQ
ncbi:sarcosine oxidase subunit gamma [Mesorhizobium sp. M0317]|uniref:sarcosine oxidase subunit gamma n=1 Tax=Mesorhizobium sp. M0317 TaxID=2956935 RepID=UPI0033367EBA